MEHHAVYMHFCHATGGGLGGILGWSTYALQQLVYKEPMQSWSSVETQ